MSCETKFDGVRGALHRVGPSGKGTMCMACRGAMRGGSVRLVEPSAALGARNVPLGRRELCARCGLLGFAYQDCLRPPERRR